MLLSAPLTISAESLPLQLSFEPSGFAVFAAMFAIQTPLDSRALNVHAHVVSAARRGRADFVV